MGENGMAADSGENALLRFMRRFPAVPAAAVALLALVFTGNRIDNNFVTFALMIAGFICILVIGLVMGRKGKLTDDKLIFLLFAAGFWIRLCYVLYTHVEVRQNDVGIFREGTFANMHSHADYMLYIRDHLRLPEVDVKGYGQFYHPPLHYIICALFIRLYELFLPAGTHNYECVQTLTLIYSFGAQYYMFRTIRHLGVKGKALVNAALLLAAFPSLTLFAGSVNNDILSLMLFFAGFYYGLRWYGEGKMRDIVISALCVGFGMMTKLSIGLIAAPLGFLFVVRFVKDVKAKKGLRSLGQLVLFIVIAAPLGLWYSIKNFVRYGTPFGYVIRVNSIYMDISRFSVKDRLFGFYGFPIEDYFVNTGSDGEQDYNIFITQIKTMLFEYENCRDDMLMTMTGYFLLLVTLILVALVFVGLVYVLVTIKKRGVAAEELALLILFVTEVVAAVIFSLNYPHVCSQDFRYDFPALLTAVYCIAGLSDSKACKGLGGKGMRLLCIAFFVMSVLYYSILWTYVKGVPILVEPTW